jgi:hypothetical protein
MQFRWIFLGTLLTLGAHNVAHADLIEVNAPIETAAFYLGYPNTTTYGEVFTVPTGGYTQLNNFSFYIDGTVPEAYAGVAAWTGTGAGPALFSSTPFSIAYGTPSNDGPFEQITIDTGGLNLTAGQDYVAYFSVAGLASSSSDDDGFQMASRSAPGSAGNDVGWVFYNADGGSPNGANWTCDCGNIGSLAYTMDFSQPVQIDAPEPAAIGLVGSGIVGLGVFRRRKKTCS